MTHDELEFSISQFLDGTLAVDEEAALKARLERDAEARALLEEHRRLTALLKAQPLPEVNWDALASHLSKAVAREEAPAQSYRLFNVSPRVMALAASILVVLGVGVTVLLNRPGRSAGEGLVIRDVHPDAAVAVSSPDQSSPEVTVGPSRALAANTSSPFAEDVVSRPSRVVIASGVEPAQDTSNPLY